MGGIVVEADSDAPLLPPEEAAKWKPDLLIYLTDLEGEAEDEPGFPVLWAVPEGRPHAPWRRVVELI